MAPKASNAAEHTKQICSQPRLSLPKHLRHPTFHVSQLKPVSSSNLNPPSDSPPPPGPSIIHHPTYGVRKLLEAQGCRSWWIGRGMVLTRAPGFPVPSFWTIHWTLISTGNTLITIWRLQEAPFEGDVLSGSCQDPVASALSVCPCFLFPQNWAGPSGTYCIHPPLHTCCSSTWFPVISCHLTALYVFMFTALEALLRIYLGSRFCL